MAFSGKRKRDDRPRVDERKLQEFVDWMPMPAAFTTAEGVLTVSNDSYQRLLWRDREHVPPHALINDLVDALEIGSGKESEVRIARDDGQEKLCRLRSHQVFSDKETTYSLLLLEDLSEQLESAGRQSALDSALALHVAAARVLIEHDSEQTLISALV